MTASLFAIGAVVCAFVAGLIIGAYGHKWLAKKATSVGVTPPSKLP